MNKSIQLLRRLISTPSTSRTEDAAADIVQEALTAEGVKHQRLHNNVWALNLHYNPSKPTLLLNSHLDTVKPSASYTRDPYAPTIEEGRLYGLGSNDAGASGVSLLNTFCQFYREQLPFNLLLALTAEEEVMGENGMRSFLPAMESEGIKIDMAIVGEPTGMQPAIAERGLLVLDCVAHGKAGHAARNEGVNALYKAIDDINLLRSYKFDVTSQVLGPIKVSATMIECGTQHNVVPDSCRYVLDVRTTDAYTNQQTVDILQSLVESTLTPRSTRVQASVLLPSEPLYQAAVNLGGVPYVSPTTSDMALMHTIPSLKIGPGDSSRSHTADEFVYVAQIEEALSVYPRLIMELARFTDAK